MAHAVTQWQRPQISVMESFQRMQTRLDRRLPGVAHPWVTAKHETACQAEEAGLDFRQVGSESRDRMPPVVGPLTPGIGQTIVPCVEMNALRVGLHENRSRAVARSHENAQPWAALLVLGKKVAIASLFYLGACKQPLVVGEYKCPVRPLLDGGVALTGAEPITLPWSTGFENQLDCDYREVAGSCYGFPPGLFRVVASPVHSGQFAAEFTVLTGTDAGATPQGRCMRTGVFPAEAYYGAWYYIEQSATNNGLWNLFHFQGGDDLHLLWDVSLVNGTTDAGPTGPLTLHVYSKPFPIPANARIDGPPVPIGSWFHIEFYWKRAEDKTGEVALYQDGIRVVNLTNIVTDNTGTGQGQWYVGNLADALQPPRSTVYVDDITIRATP